LFGDIQFRNINYSLSGIDSDLQQIDGAYNYQFINPKFGINYFLADKTSLYASYSVGNKEPSRSDFLDNANGKIPQPETLHDFEIGYRKLGDKVLLNTNFYYMNYKNQLVLTGELNDVGTALRTNVSSSFRAGLEMDVSYLITKKWSILANATFSKNVINNFTEIIYDYGTNWDEYNRLEVDYGKTDIAYSPEIIAGAAIKYQLFNGLSLSWNNRYVGEQYLDNTSIKDRKIDGYYLSDFRANYSFSALKMESIGINLAVYNLFNQMYESNGYTYGYRGGGTEIRENFFYPQAGINFMAGITLKL
jgi:Outer membrane receptor for monomeric catechols